MPPKEHNFIQSLFRNLCSKLFPNLAEQWFCAEGAIFSKIFFRWKKGFCEVTWDPVPLGASGKTAFGRQQKLAKNSG